MSHQPPPPRPDFTQPTPAGVVLYLIAALVIGTLLVVGFASGCKAWIRYQHRADANNRVKISAIEIRNQGQRIQVAKQRAQIRLASAVGVREAQDEIAKTLTPLYVQFEMVDALRRIATSGSNNSVVYLPSGANGVPLVSTLPGPVGLPQDGRK